MSALSALTHVFPPPRYMTMPSAGFDISESSLKYVQLRREHSHDRDLTLTSWGDIDIPDDTVVRGDITNVSRMSSILKEARERCNIEHAHLSLPEERAYIFETAVHRGTPFKEIRGLLEFKLEENVPLSPRDAFFDYDIVEDGDATDMLRVVVTVYGKDTILSYYEACVSAGIVPLSFEVEAQAISRAAIAASGHGTYMIVDFGKTRTGVGVVHNHRLMYTSTIDIGGFELSASMRNVLGDVSESELTKIKNAEGLKGSHQSEAVQHALMLLIERISSELQARVTYWNTKDIARVRRDISEVIVCGGSANLAGLPEYLTEKLGIHTRRANVWRNAFSLDTFVPPIGERYSYGYATAIGLALKDHLRF